MTLLICPVRPGDQNEELRYALRTWETNLVLPELTLMTVGYQPSWLLPDIHVPGNRFKSSPLAVFDNVRLGAEEAVRVSGNEEVVYMNDDFFCLDPVGKVLPVRRNVDLATQMAGYPSQSGLWWGRSLHRTASWLASEGFPHPDSYEVHRPLPVAPEQMLSTLDRWGPADREDTVPQWRTIYGVLNGIEAHPVPDVKVGSGPPRHWSPWLSTSDQSWRLYAARIGQRYKKPSRWEK